jgi:hypothetical protein
LETVGGGIRAGVPVHFLAAFLKLTGQGQTLGPNVGPSYAPKKLSKHPDAKGSTHKLAAAING